MQAHDATRMVAVVGGVLGLGLFYQPWVEGKVPGLAAPVALTGYDLAVGRARELADAATAPPPRISVAAPGASGPAAGAAPAGGLALPTRVPTFAPGQQAPAPPTRIATPAAPGAPAAQPTPAPPAAGGMTLPTRVPTFAPGQQAPAPPTSVATRAPAAPGAAPAAPASAGGSGLAGAALAMSGAVAAEPEQLPKLTLYGVPLSAIGIVVFTATFGLLRDARDRRFAKWWTILFGVIGAWIAGTVVSTVAGAAASNDLLAPGQATAVLWAAWGSVASFVASVIGLAWTWIAMARQDRGS